MFGPDQLARHARQVAAGHVLEERRGGEKLLPALLENERALQAAFGFVLEDSKPGRRLVPAAEWLLDNYYLVEEQIILSRRHLPRGYSRELPRLKGGPRDGFPRVYDIVMELIAHTDGRFDEADLAKFVAAYQEVSVLRVGELWAIPIMVRLALVDSVRRVADRVAAHRRDANLAAEWAAKFIRLAQQQPRRLIVALADLVRSEPALTRAFVAELATRLQGQHQSLSLILQWLDHELAEHGRNLEDVLRGEGQDIASDQVSISNSIVGLRALGSVDWPDFVEAQSVVEAALRHDPTGIYARMDFNTRDSYRHVVEHLRKRCTRTEVEIANEAVALAAGAPGTDHDDRRRHVGHYLVGKGLAALKRRVRYRPPFSEAVSDRCSKVAGPLYAAAILLVTLVLTGLVFAWGVSIGMDGWRLGVAAAAAALLASQVAVSLVNWMATELAHPKHLPRMNYRKGIPDDARAVVAVPTLLGSAGGAREQIEALEVRYLANRDPNLSFVLLTDFLDAPAAEAPHDERVLHAAVSGVRALNQKYAPAHPFLLLHRPRLWNPAQGVWMGHERKRGKVTDFTTLLATGDRGPFTVIEGNADRLRDTRYAIVLDADTQLPPEAAWRLVGTLAHPLNAARIDPATRTVREGYGLLQPRVTIGLAGAGRSLYARLFSTDSGIDPYTRQVSDVYQDVFGEASFIGKGILDVRVFHACLAGRLPENSVLSHDLLESCYARCGFAGDLDLIEDHPSRYAVDAARRHRWVRGDWQIIGWLLPRSPRAGGRERNPLNLLSRWKVSDNLRRSLLPIAALTLISLAWLALPDPAAWVLLTLGMLLLPEVLRAIHALVDKPPNAGLRLHLFRESHKQALRMAQAALALLFLPFEAVMHLDAIGVTAWRRLISHRRLLVWQTAAATERSVRSDLRGVCRGMWAAPLLSAILAGVIAWHRPEALPVALPLLLCWFLAPLLAWWISLPRGIEAPRLDSAAREFLRSLARRTWRFYEQYVTERTRWLPPDNYQEKPIAVLAERTSPTNIGMAAIANLAAWDFGYLTTGELLDRTRLMFASMDKLERHRGHFFNWYSTATLHPLPPRYVSTVDSGNLAAFLLVLRQGLLAMEHQPVALPQWFDGLRDTALLQQESLKSGDEPGSDRHARLKLALAPVLERPEGPAPSDPELRAILKNLVAALRPLQESPESIGDESHWWLGSLWNQSTRTLDELNHFLPWPAPSPAQVDGLVKALVKTGAEADEISALEKVLRRGSRLGELARFHDRFGDLLRGAAAALGEPAWLAEINGAAEASSLRAGERLADLTVLTDRCQDLAAMDFTFLFDRGCKLFSIGFHFDHQKLDTGYYDLLASEARIASYLAISQAQVPQEHWFLLSRSRRPAAGGAAAVSWSGSMFEYLMPNLIAPTFRSTLLDETCHYAVKAQIEYGAHQGVPWGVSESGYNLVDGNLNYQYRAFGVPTLAVKAGLAGDTVVAPYASAMALMVKPQAALQNLRRLAGEGFVGACGLYEAVDYTPRRLRAGERYAIVRSFMAHHSGMTLLSLCHTLLGQPMQKRFVADPEFRSTLLLLQERVPTVKPESVLSELQARQSERRHEPDRVPRSTKAYPTAATTLPAVGLLGNGRYHVMLTNAGGGYSRWNDLALTRWRADSTRDNRGMFCYLRDLNKGTVWSAAHQPVGRIAERYEAIFSQGKVEFNRLDDQIETQMHVSVSPEDDAEVRRVTVRNVSRETRRVEVTTYAEVVLAPQGADVSHPAFSNLFVETQLAPEAAAIFCKRRPRDAQERPPWLFHLATGGPEWSAPTFETDRAAFIGRGRSTRSPLAMSRPGPLGGTAGAVLDPIVAIRRVVSLKPGQSAELMIVTGAAAEREAAAALVQKYSDRRLGERAFETAWTHNQVQLQQLGAPESDAPLFNRLAGPLIFADLAMRAPASVIARNRRGQSGLWGQAISGDLPIVLLTVTDPAGVDLVVRAAKAHCWWRAKGLRADLIVLIDEGTGYRQNVIDQINGHLSSGPEALHIDKPGGVFLRNSDKLSDEDRILLQASARLTLSDRAGSLDDQAERLARAYAAPPPLQPAERGTHAGSDGDLPPRSLRFFNGRGGFTDDGREYVIRLEPGNNTPAPWANVIANGLFGTVVSESGGAYTWAENAHEFRLTPWHNDPVSDTSGEWFYIRDEITGRFWSPCPLPARGRGPYLCRHGQGYSIFEHDQAGIFSEMTTYLATDAPVKFVVVKLRNHSGRSRRVSATGCFEWVLGEQRDKNAMHIVTRHDPRTGAVMATNAYNQDFPGRVAFAQCLTGDRTYTGDRAEFLGRNGSPQSPAAMRRQRLSNRTGVGLDPCAAFHATVDIPDGGERQVVFLLGAAQSEADAHAILHRFRGADAARQALEKVWEQWKRLLGAVYIETPDAAMNTLFNQWSLYQTIACRVWGRSGYYQSGGAYGFRDQLQDTMALLFSAPWLLREQLVRSASRQFREGDVQHWWHPPLGRGVRTHFSDDYLWLPLALCRYVVGTGDTGVLKEEISFLEGRPVKADEEAYYDLPKVSDERAPLYEHATRAIRRALRLMGPHGLPLMGCGDWNDGMNKVGEHGRGESVWLAFFLYDILLQFPRVAEIQNDPTMIEECRAAADTLRKNIEAHAWDGKWYRRAYFDDGTPLGSSENAECRIDSLAQSWAVLSGAGDAQRAAQAMESLDHELVDNDLKLIKLFTPPFDQTPLNPGYIKGYIPGVRENGAQYTHAAVWAVMAFATLRDAKRAWRYFSYLNPIHHSRNAEAAERYGVEPYAIVADIYTNPQHAGRGGWTWYTGSAGWTYRLMLETLLGMTLEVDRLSFAPVVPAEWKEFRIHYRHRETLYHITLKILGPETWTVGRVSVDGQEQAEKTVLLRDDRVEHQVEVEVG